MEVEKSELKLIVCEALEEVVLPQIQDVRDDVSYIKTGLLEFKKEMSEFREENREEHAQMHADINRIETIQHADGEYIQSVDLRVKRLEEARADGN